MRPEPPTPNGQPRKTGDHIADIQSLGLKATAPRIKVLRVFQQNRQRHLSADDVYKILLGEGADVGLATVYRVLMQFERAGLLSRQHFEAGKAVFELDEGHHHDHLVCLHCGQVLEFADSAIERRQQEIARELGFELQEHVLALYGFCSDQRCRSRRPPLARTPAID